MGRHQSSRQRPQWAELTGEDELLLHHVDIAAGPPDGSAQHDLLGVVAAHAAGAVPEGGWEESSQRGDGGGASQPHLIRGERGGACGSRRKKR